MDKKYKLAILATVSFIIFAVTMFYVDDIEWLMIISLISFISFLLSILHIVLNIKTKLDSK